MTTRFKKLVERLETVCQAGCPQLTEQQTEQQTELEEIRLGLHVFVVKAQYAGPDKVINAMQPGSTSRGQSRGWFDGLRYLS